MKLVNIKKDGGRMGNDFEEIRPKDYFRLNDGRVIRSLHELLEVLNTLDEETFRFHVNEDKNDFGNWIRDVFKDEDLCNSVFGLQTRGSIAGAIKARLQKLKKYQNKRFSNTPEKPRKMSSKIVISPKNSKALLKKSRQIQKMLARKQADIEKKLAMLDKKQAGLAYEKGKQEKQISSKKKLVEEKQEKLHKIETEIRQKDRMLKGKLESVENKEKELEINSKNLVREYKKVESLEGELKQKEAKITQSYSNKIEEVLMKEKEIEKREKKIEEIEARIEMELAELVAKKEPKFFSKEFIQGMAISLLLVLVVVLAYVKFFI